MHDKRVHSRRGETPVEKDRRAEPKRQMRMTTLNRISQYLNVSIFSSSWCWSACLSLQRLTFFVCFFFLNFCFSVDFTLRSSTKPNFFLDENAHCIRSWALFSFGSGASSWPWCVVVSFVDSFVLFLSSFPIEKKKNKNKIVFILSSIDILC